MVAEVETPVLHDDRSGAAVERGTFGQAMVGTDPPFLSRPSCAALGRLSTTWFCTNSRFSSVIAQMVGVGTESGGWRGANHVCPYRPPFSGAGPRARRWGGLSTTWFCTDLPLLACDRARTKG